MLQSVSIAAQFKPFHEQILPISQGMNANPDDQTICTIDNTIKMMLFAFCVEAKKNDQINSMY